MRSLLLAVGLLATASLPHRATWAAPEVPSAAPALTVSVAPAVRGTVAETVLVTGTLVPREEVLVSPQIDGLAVTEILAEEGDRVLAGQVLARLSRELLDANLAGSEAQLARAEAAAAQARAQIGEAQAARTQADLALSRSESLIRTGAASREVLEQRQATAQATASRLAAAESFLRVAEADRAAAVAQRQELLVRIGRTELRTPVGGLVSRRAARLGAVVSAGGDPLFRVVAGGIVELEADVPETQLARLRPGQPAQVTASGAKASRSGAVRLVSPEVSRTSRLGRVRIGVEGDSLPTGAFARAVVEVARREDVVLVPLSAVLAGPDGAAAQVVRDGVVETRRVRLGLQDALRVEVLDGLREGEQVVAVSGTFVRDGDRVKPVGATVPTGVEAPAGGVAAR